MYDIIDNQKQKHMRLAPKHELYLVLNNVSTKNQDATETFKFRARQIHGNRFNYSRSIYKGCNKDIEIICRLHGSFNTTPTMHFQASISCPYCAQGRYTPELFLKTVNRLHSQNYTYPDVKLIQFVRSTGVIKIECPTHGTFYQRLDVHLRGNGCPECSGKPYNHGNAAIYNTQRLSYLGE